MKTIHKNPLIITSLFLLAGAGCITQTATNSTVNADSLTNTNAISDDNVSVDTVNTAQENVDTNTTVVNENTNVTVEAGDTSTDATSEVVDTSNWLTYTNEEYGFSFRYPKDWILEILQEGGLGTDAGDVKVTNNVCDVFIAVPHEKDGQDKAVNMYYDALESGSYGGESVKQVLLGSIQAIQYLNPKFAYESEGEIYKFVINNQLFSSTFSYDPGDENCATPSEAILMSIQLDS